MTDSQLLPKGSMSGEGLMAQRSALIVLGEEIKKIKQQYNKIIIIRTVVLTYSWKGTPLYITITAQTQSIQRELED